MAIKISGTTVIDDSRNIQNIGVITATAFVGDGSGLTGAGSTVFNNTATNQEFFPLFTATTSGTITASGISTSKLKYNPSTGTVTATAFVGSGSGLTGAGSTVSDDTSTNATFYPVLTQTTSGTITASKVSTTKLTFNPSTGGLTVGIVSVTGIGTFGTNGTGTRTIQSGGTASGGSSGDIYYIY